MVNSFDVQCLLQLYHRWNQCKSPFHLIVLVCSTDKYILYLQTAVQQDKISTAAHLD